jgi:hypothetical protein
MSDFDLQIFGGVTRLAAARAFPPWGAACDLCAKFVLYAMKNAKIRLKNAKNSPRGVFSRFLNYPRAKIAKKTVCRQKRKRASPRSRRLITRCSHMTACNSQVIRQSRRA